jgi:hypothetical protein
MEHLQSIRDIMKFRDDLNDEEITELFSMAKEQILDGEDPTEVLEEVFGLETDYLFDDELRIW